MDLAGKTVGRYTIESLVGWGGMGEVYRARDPVLKRIVALKRVAPQLRDNPSSRELLLKEASRASQLTNEGIAQIHDVIEEQGELFVVMEYIDGATLRSRLGSPMGLQEFFGIAEQCLEALMAAHARGIIHRDIKPENIMVTPSGHVKICDFGLAHALPLQDQSTVLDESQPAGMRGTITYMAPEALLGRPADARADIFSVGIVLYEALTGRHPFRVGDNAIAAADAILRSPPLPFPDIQPKLPIELRTLILKALEKDPSARYASIERMLADLQAIRPENATLRDGGSRRAGWSAAAIMAILTAVAAGWLVYNRLPALSARSEGRVLVVLPFRFNGPQPESQAFADGLIETVTAKLGQLSTAHKFQIISANEVHSRHAKTVDDARTEFGSDLALEGDVQNSEKNVRINYALVDAHTRKQIGSESITVPAANAFEIQDSVVAGAARLLGLELASSEEAGLARIGTRMAGAYELYLKGRGYLRDYDKPENLESAIDAFKDALKLDPDYAFAYAGIGEAYWSKYEAITKDPRWIAAAEENCERALALDMLATEAHNCMGVIESGTGNYDKAIQEFQQALSAEPANDAAYLGLATAYVRAGEFQKAEATYKQAINVRPRYWSGYSWLGAFYFTRQKYADAEIQFQKVVGLAPDSYRGFSNLGAIYLRENKDKQAIAAFEKSRTIRLNYQAASNLGTLYYDQRDYRRAADAYEEALKIQDSDHVVWGNLAKARRELDDASGSRDAYQRASDIAARRLRVNPRDVTILLQLADYRGGLGDASIARDFIAEVLSIRPHDSQAFREVARILETQLHDRTQALNYLERAFKEGLSVDEVQNDEDFELLQSDPRFHQIDLAYSNAHHQ